MASAARADMSQTGRWLTQDRGGVIDIYHCEASPPRRDRAAASALCGRIAGLSEPLKPDGTVPADSSGHPKCGLTILHDAVQSEPGMWTGRITNPDDGTSWHCEFWVDDLGRLHLRGYVLVPLLGQTQTWTPYAGSLSSDCRMG
jgi:uncharacterized protein (DUF2147 family)